MDDGKAEIQRVMDHYERLRLAAVQAQEQAEAVLPYLRAALEELEAFSGKSAAQPQPTVTKKKPVEPAKATEPKASRFAVTDLSQRAASPKPAQPAPPVTQPTPPVSASDESSEQASDDAPAKRVFSRRSIAALVAESDGKQTPS